MKLKEVRKMVSAKAFLEKRMMGLKRMALPTVCLALAVAQLTGCAPSTSEQISQLLVAGDTIEVSVDLPDGAEVIESSLVDWEPLANLSDQESLRKEIDNTLGIIAFGSSKNGVLYVNPETEEWEPNNTLENVFKNKAFVELWGETEVQDNIIKAVIENYSDLDGETGNNILKLAALNGYFNIFSNDEDGNFDTYGVLTRAEFFSGLTKVSNEAQSEITVDSEVKSALGDNELVAIASLSLDNSYLKVSTGSLNETTFNAPITRAEVVYALVKQYYAEELGEVVVKGSKAYSDCKSAGNLLSETDGAEQAESAVLQVMLNNTGKGLDEELYKAMVVAYAKGILGNTSESNWSEVATKADVLQMILNVVSSQSTTVNCQNGNSEGVDTPDEEVTPEGVIVSNVVNDNSSNDYQAQQIVDFYKEEYGKDLCMSYEEFMTTMNADDIQFIIDTDQVLESTYDLYAVAVGESNTKLEVAAFVDEMATGWREYVASLEQEETSSNSSASSNTATNNSGSSSQQETAAPQNNDNTGSTQSQVVIIHGGEIIEQSKIDNSGEPLESMGIDVDFGAVE